MKEWTSRLEKEPDDKMQTKPAVNLKLQGYSKEFLDLADSMKF